MKAIVYTRYGSPEVLQLEDIEKPMPGDYEILVKVHASTVTPMDHKFRSGKLFLARMVATGLLKPKMQVMGVEFSGEIEALGSKATKFKIGDRVFGRAKKGGGHAEDALKYLDKMLSVFGFNLVPSLELHFRPGKMPEENKRKNTEKIIAAVATMISRIEKGEKDKPSLSMMIPFNIFKYVSRLDKDTMTADFEYYKDKGDCYYDAKIPFYKRFIAKKVTNKIVSQFD